jgi:hypothetical protein
MRWRHLTVHLMHHLCKVFRELYVLVDMLLFHRHFQPTLIRFFFFYYCHKNYLFNSYVYKIIASILVVDPTRRPSVHDILNSPIVKAHMSCLPWNGADSTSLSSNPISPASFGNDGGRHDDFNSYGRSQASDVSSQSLPPQMAPKFELAAPMHAPKMKRDMKDVSMRICVIFPVFLFFLNFIQLHFF